MRFARKEKEEEAKHHAHMCAHTEVSSSRSYSSMVPLDDGTAGVDFPPPPKERSPLHYRITPLDRTTSTFSITFTVPPELKDL